MDILNVHGVLFPLCRAHLRESREHCVDLPLTSLRFLPRPVWRSEKLVGFGGLPAIALENPDKK